MLVHTTVTAALILTSALATGVQSSEREMPTHMGTLLSFNRGEQTFVEYRFSDKDFKPYVQVLRSPGGINVVRDRPYDHLHHRGLMFAVNMNGIELLTQLRNDPELNSIPFIVMTSTDQKESLLDMVRAGANDYIEKPFQAEDLRKKIEKFVN